MAVVITVAQQKGGSGKTMIAANLAASLAASKTTALLDIDPQHSLTRWHAIRTGRDPAAAKVTLSEISGWRVAGELDRLRREHEVVLVDTPPVLDTDARRAIRGADLVVVPVQPSPPDLWAAEGTLKLAEDEKRPACVVLNRVPATGRQRDAMEQELRKRKLIVLPATLGNRAAFSQAFAQGLGVTESAPRTPAATELRALLAAMLQVIG
ncbi:MAG TPA: ParA family partition ATPase [Acetobacteraceae bacterium]|nr:ParA family partition ATPase [Acetobacteraceae bacterium]